MNEQYVQPQDYATPLSQYKKNVYSQNGEDGILERLIELIGIEEPGWCCEFGAWDGRHLSNTFNLVRNRGWKAVYIEGDPDKFLDLTITRDQFPEQILAMHAMVGHKRVDGKDLDSLLTGTPIPNDFDVLSVDVDGPDYHIWKSLTDYEPKIVVVEHSGLRESIIQRPGAIHKKEKDGSTSFQPMRELGESKGYVLLVDTGNLVFMHRKYFEQL